MVVTPPNKNAAASGHGDGGSHKPKKPVGAQAFCSVDVRADGPDRQGRAAAAGRCNHRAVPTRVVGLGGFVGDDRAVDTSAQSGSATERAFW